MLKRSSKQTAVPAPSRLLLEIDCLDVEIGCGVGWHAIQYAQKNPSRQLIAIEHGVTRFQKFARRMEQHPQIQNLCAIHANALSWIGNHLGIHSVDRYFLLYPNPYPKRKQQNKRWHNLSFISYLIKTLKPGGTLELATNEKFYAEEALQTYIGHWNFTLINLSHPKTPRTHFERKYLSRGQTCWNLVFQKGPQTELT